MTLFGQLCMNCSVGRGPGGDQMQPSVHPFSDDLNDGRDAADGSEHLLSPSSRTGLPGG